MDMSEIVELSEVEAAGAPVEGVLCLRVCSEYVITYRTPSVAVAVYVRTVTTVHVSSS